MSQRPVYLIVYNNRLFPAHWAMWIPSYDADTKEVKDVGKMIHVEGDSLTGFHHELRRNYNIALTTRPKQVIFIGWTDNANIVDGTNQGQSYVDTTATDTIEQWALYIPAPGPSLRSAASSSSSSRTRVELQNCQTWMSELVRRLVENRILDEEANTIVAGAPRN